ncbi:MAG: hypothetical protein WDM80_12545 [Limisphaerales bacterium]
MDILIVAASVTAAIRVAKLFPTFRIGHWAGSKHRSEKRREL